METQTTLQTYTGFDWHNYNLSQTREKDIFIRLLNETCELIQEKEIKTKGRKPMKMKDLVFSIVMKQYLNMSSRRVNSDLRLFRECGFIEDEIHFNTLLRNMERTELRRVLKELVEISALPMQNIEQDFAIDATGFSVSRYVTYFDFKHKKDRRQKTWRKCHAVCGVKTNIITSVDISEGYSHDSNYFESLVNNTARNFKIREFSADKGYLSKKAYNMIEDLGGQAYIPFKSNSVKRSHWGGASPNWKIMLNNFKNNNNEFMSHYHKRSNIESCFSMIKRRFGNNLLCKKEISQDNEILSKVLAHNLCILVQEIFLRSIKINLNFCASNYIAHSYVVK